MLWLMRHPVTDKSIEFADNRISLFSAQYGKCSVTGFVLLPHNICCHHKISREKGGTDSCSNLVLVTENVHKLIHATKEDTIRKYLNKLDLTSKQLENCNKFRTQAELPTI